MKKLTALIGSIFIVAVLTSLTGCGREFVRPMPEINSKGGPSIEQLQYEPSWGPKKRIAVMRVENKSAPIPGGPSEIGTGMADQLVSSLVQTGAFIVLERGALQDILKEQEFGASGWVKPGTAPKIGEIEGAEFLIYGALTEYDPGYVSGKAGAEVGSFKGSAGFKQAHVAIDLKIVDVNTGRIVNATTVKGRPREIQGQIGISGQDILFGTEAYYRTPIGQAVRDCLNHAVEFIVKTAFQSKIVGQSSGKRTIDDPSAPLTVQAWTNKREYKQGELIKIYLKGNKPFYGRVVYKDSGGNLLQVLPNPYRADNFFNGGAIYEIPSDADKFDLKVSPPFGEENIIIYASTSQLGDIDLRAQGGVYQITTKPKDIGEKTRGVRIAPKEGNKEAATSEFVEESLFIATMR